MQTKQWKRRKRWPFSVWLKQRFCKYSAMVTNTRGIIKCVTICRTVYFVLPFAVDVTPSPVNGSYQGFRTLQCFMRKLNENEPHSGLEKHVSQLLHGSCDLQGSGTKTLERTSPSTHLTQHLYRGTKIEEKMAKKENQKHIKRFCNVLKFTSRLARGLASGEYHLQPTIFLIFCLCLSIQMLRISIKGNSCNKSRTFNPKRTLF